MIFFIKYFKFYLLFIKSVVNVKTINFINQPQFLGLARYVHHLNVEFVLIPLLVYSQILN